MTLANFRLSREDQARLAEVAHARGMNRTEWLRRMIDVDRAALGLDALDLEPDDQFARMTALLRSIADRLERLRQG